MSNQEADVSTRNGAMQKVYDDARAIRALTGGTQSMRAAGKEYLPQKQAESSAAYKDRLAQSTLYNKMLDTINTVAGKLFAKPITANEGFEGEEFLQSVDLEGRDITRFAHDVTVDALQPGVSYIQVDHPSVEQGLTRAQLSAMGVRPYFIMVKSENLLSFEYRLVGAQLQLTRANIMESRTSSDVDNEFKEVTTQQVRVYRVQDVMVDDAPVQRMTFEVWRQNKDEKWELAEGPTVSSIDFIPIVPLYTSRTGFMTGRPPYRDIADLNIRHWQSRSSQDHILDFSRFPMLFAKGLKQRDDGDETAVGANVMLLGEADENSDAKYIEPGGAAIQAGADDLKNIEDQMDALSKQVLTRKSGNITATARAIDESSSTTDIQALKNIVEDTINTAIGYAAIWADSKMGTVSLNADLDLSADNDTDNKMLIEMYDRRQISGETLTGAAKRRNVLDDEFDYEVDQGKIERTEVN